jgi:hypothetical protein
VTARTKQAAACLASVEEQMKPFRDVPLPVDVTDASAFPEIAAARASFAARSAEERARLLGEWE